MNRCFLLLGSLCLAACSSAESSSMEDRMQPAVVELQLGTGSHGVFAAHQNGDVLRLQRGCQGAQHIFTSLRVKSPGSGLFHVSIKIFRSEDRKLVSVPIDLRLPAEPDPEPGFVRITGLTPVVEVPRDVIGKSVQVEGIIELPNSQSGQATMSGSVEWGLDSCG